ncbi:hypothetical protein D3C86_2220960 [compost metagenome]
MVHRAVIHARHAGMIHVLRPGRLDRQGEGKSARAEQGMLRFDRFHRYSTTTALNMPASM